MSKIHSVQNAEKMKVGILLVNVSSSHKLPIVTYSLQDCSTAELACKVSGPQEWYFVGIKLIRETKQNEKKLQYIFSSFAPGFVNVSADCQGFELQRNHTRELHL